MDRGGCRLNAGGGNSQSGESGGSTSEARAGTITLEDLESFSEDHLTDSGNGSLEEESETMEDDEQERLLNYWQDIARGHQVEVPRDLAAPIQQLTTNNAGTRDREAVPFTLIARREKLNDVRYEKRHYEKANWACVTVHEDTYEQSICHGFMKIMRYICQQNSSGNYLGMTIPIVTIVRTDQARSVLSRGVTVAYFLPTEHQAQPPLPHDTDIVIEEWPATIVYTRAFSGTTNEQIIINEISGLAELLETPELCLNDTFIVAGYTNPAAADRRNEIWFLERL